MNKSTILAVLLTGGLAFTSMLAMANPIQSVPNGCSLTSSGLEGYTSYSCNPGVALPTLSSPNSYGRDTSNNTWVSPSNNPNIAYLCKNGWFFQSSAQHAATCNLIPLQSEIKTSTSHLNV